MAMPMPCRSEGYRKGLVIFKVILSASNYKLLENTYTCKNLLSLLNCCDPCPTEFLEEFDPRRIMQGGGGMGAKKRRKSLGVAQGRGARTIRQLKIQWTKF